MINPQFLSFYKLIIPAVLRERFTMMRNAGGLNTIRKNILYYYQKKAITDIEIAQVLDYLRNKPLRLFPYHFPDNYKPANINVSHDPGNGLNYVMHQHKRMYFKRSWGSDTIKEKYNDLLIEQDRRSPHCYLNEEFAVEPGEVVADIGAAEGIFALSVIEKVNKIFLFETDQEWIEALQATFRPWADKVEIIHKFVSDLNNESNISLNQFCISQDVSFDLIKVDVDGAELSLLNGAGVILASADRIKLAICTYHQQEDEALFRNIFKRYHMTVNPSLGYMVFYYDRHLAAPYLRRGLLRVVK